jgi:hypothetical protein
MLDEPGRDWKAPRLVVAGNGAHVHVDLAYFQRDESHQMPFRNDSGF